MYEQEQTYFEGDVVNSNRILYTPSAFARTSLLSLQETGSLKAQKPHKSARENLASFLFFIVKNGNGTLTYGNRVYELSEGDCAFIDCTHAYIHETTDVLWSLSWVHFYGPTMHRIYEKFTERCGQPVFHPAEPDAFLQLLAELYNIADSEDFVRDMLINEKLSALLTWIMKECWNTGRAHREANKKQYLQDIKEFLETHYAEKISLDMLSDRFYINKFYLTRIFKEQFGVSVNTYLLQIRITHAKQMLRFTDETLEAIGLACGMGDGAYFSRMFKKIEGIAPGEYRKRW